MVVLIITALFLFLYALLISYYFYHWLHLEEFQGAAEDVRVSVVVAARNEETTLPLLLQDLARQQYPASQFEVIIVNDYSTDQTAAAAAGLPANMRMILPDVPPEASSKKAAIATGVRQATGDLVVVTDADCRVTSRWLQVLAGFHREKNIVFIAAPVKLFHNHTFLEIFQGFDFLALQGITAASVRTGFHSMCNGANLAYTREAFLEVGGFEGIDHVASGDDMLLMHKIRRKYGDKVMYLKNKEVIVRTEPMKSWSAFLQQRKRWASKSLVYDDWKIIAVLGFVYILNLQFLLLMAAGFLYPQFWWLALSFWMIKTVIEFPFVYSVASFFGEKKIMPYFFLYQPAHILYTVYTGLASQVGRYRWKGRTTK